MRTRRTIAIATLALIVIVAGAWWFETHSAPGAPVPGGAGPGAIASTSTAIPTGYVVRITRDGTLLAAFNLGQLEEIGLKRVTVQSGVEEGPSLLAVLERAGAGDFSSVLVLGEGTRDSGSLTLNAAEIGPDTVLDFAKRGTVKIAGPGISRELRVRDITEIQVR